MKALHCEGRGGFSDQHTLVPMRLQAEHNSGQACVVCHELKRVPQTAIFCFIVSVLVNAGVFYVVL